MWSTTSCLILPCAAALLTIAAALKRHGKNSYKLNRNHVVSHRKNVAFITENVWNQYQESHKSATLLLMDAITVQINDSCCGGQAVEPLGSKPAVIKRTTDLII